MSKREDGQAVPVTAKIPGVPVQNLGNWIRLSGRGQLKVHAARPALHLSAALRYGMDIM